MFLNKFTIFVNLFYHNVDMIFMKFSVDNQRLSTYLFIRYKLVFYLINRLSSSTTSTTFVFQKFTIFVNQFCHFFIYISTPGLTKKPRGLFFTTWAIISYIEIFSVTLEINKYFFHFFSFLFFFF